MEGVIKISFILERSKSNAKGECPVLCRISKGRCRKQFRTGVRCLAKEWDNKRSKVKGSNKEVQIKNQYIKLAKDKLETYILEYSLEDEELTVEMLYDLYKGERKTSYTLMDAFDFHKGNIEKQIGKGFSEATLRRYRVIQGQLSEFLIKCKGKQDIGLCELNLAFLEDFQIFLKTEKDHKPVTYVKTVQRVRKVINYVIKYDWLDSDPFKNFKPEKFKNEVVFLTKSELDLLERCEFRQERLQKVKDCFIFCCYT